MIHSLDEKNHLCWLTVRICVSIYHRMSLIFFYFQSCVQPLCLFYFQVLSEFFLFASVVVLCALVLRLVSLTSEARLLLGGFLLLLLLPAFSSFDSNVRDHTMRRWSKNILVDRHTYIS